MIDQERPLPLVQHLDEAGSGARAPGGVGVGDVRGDRVDAGGHLGPSASRHDPYARAAGVQRADEGATDRAGSQDDTDARAVRHARSISCAGGAPTGAEPAYTV